MDEPFTELQAAAMQVHELFRAYIAAGFTEPQALQIVIALVTRPQQGPQ